MVSAMRGLGLATLAFVLAGASPVQTKSGQPEWRDCNHNGKMDRYEDPRLPVAARVEDLLARMTLEEKAGLLVHGTLPGLGSPIGASSVGYDLDATRALIADRHVNSMISRLVLSPATFAAQNNAVQKLAAETRLGIPVTISTDPRHHFQAVLGASTTGGGFSLWPDTLGLAALDDVALVRRFGDVARREYRAVGLHMALSPQADLGSEPRWARYSATFGADPATVSRLAGAYVEGFQHGATGLARDGVATVTKHWVGYGAEPQGFDGHNYYGRNAQLTDASFAAHLKAFEGPLKAGTAGIMPTYVILNGVTIQGKPLEKVGAGFSRPLITDLLRGTYRYRGLVVSDWSITRDCPESCRTPDAAHPQGPEAIGMPWGVEDLDPMHRYAKGLDAGIDQFGGVNDADAILAAVRAGLVSKARIDQSARRVLALKFELGLFDNPFVDPARAAIEVGSPAMQAEADLAQATSQVLLRNAEGLLPLAAGKRVWLHNVDATAAREAGLVVVDRPEDAEVALVRTATPFEKLHPYAFFGSRQHEGRLDFRDQDADVLAMAKVPAGVPLIAAVTMDRPAVLGPVDKLARALLVDFGASDAMLLKVVTGKAAPRGHLPFALPASMADVEAQRPDLPDDGAAPLYPRGAGLAYPGTK